MHFIYSLVEGINDIFIDRISRESDAEIVIGASHQLDDRVLALIVDIVGAQINVLELNILEEDIALDLLPVRVSVSGILNHVKERDRLLGFLGGLKFLILLNDRIASLYLGLVGLNLILGEGQAANLVKDLRGLHGLQVALRETQVFEVAVHVQHVRQEEDGGPCYRVVAEVQYFK